jgi:nitroimidazol reductase NimA-like FMN-containing flavoprotein (pyridoxamine 5'-phosphate oxidase superfamily)
MILLNSEKQCIYMHRGKGGRWRRRMRKRRRAAVAVAAEEKEEAAGRWFSSVL